MDITRISVAHTPFDLALIAFASLYIVEVVTRKEGPFLLFRRLRDWLRRPLGGLLDCSWCLIVWVAAVLLVTTAYAPFLTWVFAVAGGTMVVRSYSGVQHG